MANKQKDVCATITIFQDNRKPIFSSTLNSSIINLKLFSLQHDDSYAISEKES